MPDRPEGYPHGAYFERDGGDGRTEYVPREPWPSQSSAADRPSAEEWEDLEEAKGDA